MTKEQEFEELKTAVLRRYTEYCDVVRNSTLSGLNDFNKRKRLIDAFVLSVDANAAFRNFIYKYQRISTSDNKG
jgi:hypothetical protein